MSPNPFNDTNNSEILKAYNLGIVKGMAAGRFAPLNPITRQEICVMFCRTLKAVDPGIDMLAQGVGPFEDEQDIASWAIDHVRYANKIGIMKGTSGNRISPLGKTTREQAIVLAKRSFDFIYSGKTADSKPVAMGDYNSWAFSANCSIGDMAISGDGSRLVVGDQGGNLYLFSSDSREPVWTFNDTYQFNSVDISRDGKTVVAACNDTSKVYLFIDDNPQPLWIFDAGEPRGNLQEVAISADGRFIAAADYDNVYLFARENGTPKKTFSIKPVDGQWLCSLEISGDGSTIAAGNWITSEEGGTLYVFNQSSQLWKYKMPYKPQSENAVKMPIAISYDGSFIACGGSDGSLYFFNKSSAEPEWSYNALESKQDQVSSLDISDDGKSLVAAGCDTLYFFNDTGSGQPFWVYNGDFDHPDMFGAVPRVYPQSLNEKGSYGIGNYRGAI